MQECPLLACHTLHWPEPGRGCWEALWCCEALACSGDQGLPPPEGPDLVLQSGPGTPWTSHVLGMCLIPEAGGGLLPCPCFQGEAAAGRCQLWAQAVAPTGDVHLPAALRGSLWGLWPDPAFVVFPGHCLRDSQHRGLAVVPQVLRCVQGQMQTWPQYLRCTVGPRIRDTSSQAGQHCPLPGL